MPNPGTPVTYNESGKWRETFDLAAWASEVRAVEKELNDFLSFKFFPRSGGGIGVTRMLRALKLSGLMDYDPEADSACAATSALEDAVVQKVSGLQIEQ